MTTLLADDVVRHPEIKSPEGSFEFIPEYHPGLATALVDRDFQQERQPADLHRLANHGELDRNSLVNLEIGHGKPALITRRILILHFGDDMMAL